MLENMLSTNSLHYYAFTSIIFCISNGSLHKEAHFHTSPALAFAANSLQVEKESNPWSPVAKDELRVAFAKLTYGTLEDLAIIEVAGFPMFFLHQILPPRAVGPTSVSKALEARRQ